MTLNIPGDREVMQALSDQVREALPTDSTQTTDTADTTVTTQQTPQAINPSQSQGHLPPKANPGRKARPTRAATKVQQQAQGTEATTEELNRIGDTQVPEPPILEPSQGVSNTLGASHVPGAISSQARHITQPISGSGPASSATTMDNLIEKLIQAQEEGRDEAADQYFKLIKMMTTKTQTDPQPQMAAQQQALAVVPAKGTSLDQNQQGTTEVRGLKFVWGVSNDA
ncbi:hypothetical protein Pst134EA_013178 [Puccinia striiformis f. sp. tritici]|uniref:hypothetical protein n=1 Tax=Puccinia striiformis f. sp. tritici TaxID=168172 RepID=UPI002008BEB6|nr:hypothetical protein Pst134EA_013178 [Puccinia striiformis f. sp. tritici]KAH9465288.1 hypothetical protein Pst134EA_013178 [Puccinia striiformis f. sp. tritici]